MNSTPIITTDRLILRKSREADVDVEAEFFASDRAEFLGGKQSREQVWRMVATLIGHWEMRGYGFFAVEEKTTGAYVGHVGPWYPEGWPEPELGWTIMNGFEGKGYAFEAAVAARKWVYDTLGWTTAISLIDPANARSIALAKRLGAAFDSEYTHERYGLMHVYRHPSPEGLQ